MKKVDEFSQIINDYRIKIDNLVKNLTEQNVSEKEFSGQIKKIKDNYDLLIKKAQDKCSHSETYEMIFNGICNVFCNSCMKKISSEKVKE